MNALIVSNELWNEHTGLIKLKPDSDFNSAYMPGQLCMLSVNVVENGGVHISYDPLLRRTFAPYEVNKNDDTISIMYALVGRGTHLLAKQQAGSVLSLSIPHGKPFKLLSNKKVALVAGGVGIAPMKVLGETLAQKGCDVTVYYGGRNKSLLYEPLLMGNFGFKLVLATEDGSVGEKGFATSILEQELTQGVKFDMCYTCGPKPMMKVVFGICSKYNLPLEVSMEEIMACGIGVCGGCMTKVKEEGKEVLKRCCTEGPVFDGYRVEW